MSDNQLEDDFLEKLSFKPAKAAPIPGEEDPFIQARNNARRRGTPSPTKSNRGKVAYVVFNGRVRGVHFNWASCSASVNGFSDSSYAGYRSIEEAEEAWEQALQEGIQGNPRGPVDNEPVPHQDSSSQLLPSSIAYPVVPPPSLQNTCTTRFFTPPSSPTKLDSSPTSPTKLDSSVKASPSNTRLQNDFCPPPPQPTNTSRKTPSPSKNLKSLQRREYWWVVIKGMQPGAYYTERAARQAAGKHELVLVERAVDEASAEKFYATALNHGHVALLPPS